VILPNEYCDAGITLCYSLMKWPELFTNSLYNFSQSFVVVLRPSTVLAGMML